MRFLFIAFALLTATALPTESAWAMKDRTIVLRATGSGALIGLAAGIVSYPFAKSTGTIVGGVVVGALLGTVYGFYLVDRRDDQFRTTRLDEIELLNESRNAVLKRGKPAAAEFAVPVSVFEF